MNLKLPENYKPTLDIKHTQAAIKYIRDTFQDEFGKKLKLTRVSAPLFVSVNSGLNDNLNGYEKAVSFKMQEMINEELEIVHSLAKWKRFALKKYGYALHEGIYTNMNAIRKDEKLDNLHSAYVDQWDWEKIISKEERNIDTLKAYVCLIYKIIKHMEHQVWYKYPEAVKHLKDDVFFITSEQLLQSYPNLSPKEREYEITKKYGSVFIINIGNILSNGQVHDQRAPDYDDWSMNGDLLIYHDIIDEALEISSMGIRVDKTAILNQLKIQNHLERLNYDYHKAIINEELPYTIGGGIGQSRLCMLLLNKAHIGEVQASVWPKEMIKTCLENNIFLL